MSNVDSDPMALEPLSYGDRRSAAAERVEHHVPLVAAGLDDTVQECLGFLRRVAKPFLGPGRDRIDVNPIVRQGSCLELIKEPFQTRCATGLLGPVDQAGFIQLILKDGKREEYYPLFTNTIETYKKV